MYLRFANLHESRTQQGLEARAFSLGGSFRFSAPKKLLASHDAYEVKRKPRSSR
jgi:hypothetical protein